MPRDSDGYGAHREAEAWLVVVASTPDGVAERAGKREDHTDHEHDNPDAPQDGELGKERGRISRTMPKAIMRSPPLGFSPQILLPATGRRIRPNV